jgi:phosphoribosylaminoimidazole-succinocarboxamide synthase
MDNNLIKLIHEQIKYAIKDTNYNIGKKYKGKVRDVYDLGDKLLLIATDRISAFDKVLGVIPFKGEILTGMSQFWFENTKDIIQNHIIKQVHSNAVLVKKCSIVPIEVIIRGYLTGGGWREYQKTGEICGNKLPKNLKKDSKFEKPIFTPTTKAVEGHDESITKEEIIKQKIITEELLNKIETTAYKLFERGTKIAEKNNLILVDTKYEFGILEDGSLILADEIHTSDSSRYWYLDTYEKLFNQGKEQKMVDKEFLRQWLMDNNFKGDGEPPVIPEDIIAEVCLKYINAYEIITGLKYKIEVKDALMQLDEAIKKGF